MPAVLSSCLCLFGCLRFISCVQSHLHVAALGLSRAAGGAVGPATAGRQNASVLLLELGTHKVGVVGEAAALQLDEEENTRQENTWGQCCNGQTFSHLRCSFLSVNSSCCQFIRGCVLLGSVFTMCCTEKIQPLKTVDSEVTLTRLWAACFRVSLTHKQRIQTEIFYILLCSSSSDTTCWCKQTLSDVCWGESGELRWANRYCAPCRVCPLFVSFHFSNFRFCFIR